MATKLRHLKWIIPLAGIVLAVGVLGYLKLFAWNPERQKIAQINGRQITVAQFGRELAKIPAPYQDMLREDPRQYLEELVVREVLVQEARRLGVKNDPGAQGEQADMSMVQNLLKKEVLDRIQVTPAEVEELYRQHKDQLGGKTMNELAPFIESAVREAKGKDAAEAYIISLKNKANIQIDEKRLQKIAAPPPPTNTQEEFKQALQSGKPVLVSFGGNFCLPCRQLRPTLKEVGQEFNGKAQVLVIDVYQYKDLAAEYRIQALPTLVFLDKTGKEVFRHMGAWDKGSIMAKLQEAGAA